MVEDIQRDPNNRFSNETKRLVNQLQTLSTKATQLVPRLYESLRNDGLEALEARQFIEEIVSISQRQLRKVLPDEAKNENMIRDLRPKVPQLASDTNPKQEIHIPIKSEVKEVEPEPEPQTQPSPKSNIVKQLFDPSMLDRNAREHVFILYIDLSNGNIVKYETIGRKFVKTGWR